MPNNLSMSRNTQDCMLRDEVTSYLTTLNLFISLMFFMLISKAMNAKSLSNILAQ